MLSWVICSWMVGGAAPPPAFALLFLARAELESSLGFLTAKEAWSWNKRQLSIYNVVCVNQNHCFLIKSQEKQICESGSCFPNIFTFFTLNIQYSEHSAVFLNLNKSSADCWLWRDYWGILSRPRLLTMLTVTRTWSTLISLRARLIPCCTSGHCSFSSFSTSLVRRGVGGTVLYCWKEVDWLIDCAHYSLNIFNYLRNFFYRNPFIPDNFINGQPLFGICFETSLDELLSVLGNVCPLRLWKLVLPWRRLLWWCH